MIKLINKPLMAFVSYTIFVSFIPGYIATYLIKGKI